MAAPQTGQSARDQAERVIVSVARARGQTLAELPDGNAVSFKDASFSFDPEEEQIIVAVKIQEFSGWLMFPDWQANYRQTLAALRDPDIGGRFEHADGEWLFD